MFLNFSARSATGKELGLEVQRVSGDRLLELSLNFSSCSAIDRGVGRIFPREFFTTGIVVGD